MKSENKIEKYNTRVRQAISEQYVKSTKEKCSVSKEYEGVLKKLKTERNELTYSEYTNLEKYAENLCKKLSDIKIQIDIWDKAREICLDVADETF